MEDLNMAVKKAKNNKAPGPDGIPMEFFKWSKGELRNETLEIINQIWRNTWFLENMEEANVVTLYKKEMWKTYQIIGQSLCCNRYTKFMQD